MQELSVTVDYCPKNSDSASQQAWPAQQITQQGLRRLYGLAACGGDPYTPGFHGQRLPTVAPEPDEVEEQNQKKMYPEEERCCQIVGKGADQKVRKQQCNGQQGENNQEFVTHPGEPANDSGGGGTVKR